MKSKKYGKVPKEELDSFAANSLEHGGEADPNNISDHILADRLGDSSDPRELYVRRDLEHRQYPTGFPEATFEIERRLTGGQTSFQYRHQLHSLSDGTNLLIAANSLSGQGPATSYYHEWGNGKTGTNHPRYSTVLSPQEHDEMISKLQHEGLLITDSSHRMSRDKPLVISYRRNLAKKYAVSTVGRVFGQGKASSELAPTMVGSRLATVLQEIRHGAGKSNPRLQQLTQAALGGSHKGDVYTGIRDELFRSKDPRAVALARQYNWHKVGEGLERDKHLRDFVKASAKGTKHQNHHQMYRRFYNGIVHGKEGPDERTRSLFYKYMQHYLKKQTGKDHSYEQIEDSLRRLGETEENHEHLLRNKNLKPQSKFEVPEYPHPAYTGVPKEGKYPRKDQTTPRNKLHVGQFKRPRFRFKLNEQ